MSSLPRRLQSMMGSSATLCAPAYYSLKPSHHVNPNPSAQKGSTLLRRPDAISSSRQTAFRERLAFAVVESVLIAMACTIDGSDPAQLPTQSPIAPIGMAILTFRNVPFFRPSFL